MSEKIQLLEKENKMFRDALNCIDVCITIQDHSGKMIFCSKAFEPIEEYPAEFFMGKNLRQIEKELQVDLGFIMESMAENKITKDIYLQYISASGRPVNTVVDNFPILSDNKVIGSATVYRDFTRIRELSQKLLSLQSEVNYLRRRRKNRTQYCFDQIIGESDEIKALIEAAKKVSLNCSRVLITGETGTGKELLAQSIHNASPVAAGPFVAVNCSAIPNTLLESIFFGTVHGAFTGAKDQPGLFEEAKNGTLFLDEISSMDLSLQAKILRVLETNLIRRIGDNKETAVSTRIISALNMNPFDAIENGLLRKDLYYRLSAVTLECPPLRKRQNDMMLLAQLFIDEFNRLLGKNIKTISNDVQKLFKNYSWPGNIRELRHTIEHAMNLAEPAEEVLFLQHMPANIKKVITKSLHCPSLPDLNTITGLQAAVSEFEREIIVQALKNNKGIINRAAKELKISKQNLFYRMKRLNINIHHENSIE